MWMLLLHHLSCSTSSFMQFIHLYVCVCVCVCAAPPLPTATPPPPYAIQQHFYAFLKKNSRCKKGGGGRIFLSVFIGVDDNGRLEYFS